MSIRSPNPYHYAIFLTHTQDDNELQRVSALLPSIHVLFFFLFTQHDNEFQHLSALLPSIYILFCLLSHRMITNYNVYPLSYPLFIFHFLYSHTG